MPTINTMLPSIKNMKSFGTRSRKLLREKFHHNGSGTADQTHAAAVRADQTHAAAVPLALSFEEEDLVSIARSRGDQGCDTKGDPARCLFLPGNKFTGAWTDNPSYYTRTDRHLILNSVCWLHVATSISNVPVGEWEVILHVKVDNLNFDGDWRVGVEGQGGMNNARGWKVSEVDESFDAQCQRKLEKSGVRPIMFRNSKKPVPRGKRGLGNRIFTERRGRWTKLSFGTLRLREASSRVCFELGGGNDFWCSGITFGGLELRPCGVPWEKRRLLELCRLGKAETAVGGGSDGKAAAAGVKACHLQALPPDAIDVVAGYLHTPLPADDAVPANVIKVGGGRNKNKNNDNGDSAGAAGAAAADPRDAVRNATPPRRRGRVAYD